jgi:hypothetical protein
MPAFLDAIYREGENGLYLDRHGSGHTANLGIRE